MTRARPTRAHPTRAHPETARRRRTAPLIAFLAVVAVALGGWALIGRDGTGSTREAGLLAETRDGADALTADPQSADRGSRDAARTAPLPRLGTVAPGAPTTKRATPPTRHRPTTTTRPPSAPAPTGSMPTATTSGAPGTTTDADEVTRLTNVERAKAGCAAVKTDPRLAAAALGHSKDMVDRDYFSHTSPDGKGPGDRAAAAGYSSWSGENIAAGYPTPAAVVQGWMNSPGHKANILNCQSKATGVGYDPRKNMWTQMFGFA